MRVIPRYRPNPKRDPLKVLAAMERVSWRVLSQCFRPDCCIAATRIGIEALKPFGIAARPMPTKCVIMNEAYHQWVRGEVPEPDPNSARILVIDETCTGDGYAGHVVLVGKVQGTPFLLDLSIFQFNRPQKNIHIDPEGLLVVLSPTFEFKGDWVIPLVNSEGDGSAIFYRAFPNAPDFTITGDWALPTPLHQRTFQRMVRELVEATKIELGE